MLESRQHPTFDDVWWCYNCAIENPLVGRAEIYRIMLEKALAEKMVLDDVFVYQAIGAFQRQEPDPESPQWPSTYQNIAGLDINGYLEGFSVGGGRGNASAQFGSEVVYNFATFQKSDFLYGSGGRSLSPELSKSWSRSASLYVGFISGFRPTDQNKHGTDLFAEFHNQYSGFSAGPSITGGIGLGGSVGEFTSPSGIKGFIFGISLTTPGISSSLGAGYYTSAGNDKSYIIPCPSPRAGKVDIDSLTRDIQYGHDASLFKYGPGALITPITRFLDVRQEVARLAHNAANSYNSSKTFKGCDCN